MPPFVIQLSVLMLVIQRYHFGIDVPDGMKGFCIVRNKMMYIK